MDKKNDKLDNWLVYILECNDGTLYTGCCKDINRRLRQHNGEISGGAKYTRSRRPCKIACFTSTMTKSNAHKLEYKVKKQKRKDKLRFLKDFSEK